MQIQATKQTFDKSQNINPEQAEVSEGEQTMKYDDRKFEVVANVLKIMANPIKLAIIYHLQMKGECHVAGICEVTRMSQPLVSHHLSVMKNGGILNSRRDGKNIYYSIKMDEVKKVMECMSKCSI